ncbi:MAG: low molecular weight protein-tyrosine-phosphatase [Suipraeoptans sp.]
MTKILFICHGNICRSPMAEFVFKDMVEKRGLADCFHIESAATSREEIGNQPHYGTRKILDDLGIDYSDKRARQIKYDDYDKFDYLIGMDTYNLRNMNRMFDNDPESKLYLLLEFAGEDGDIADPWYTNKFDTTYRDVVKGCEALLNRLMEEENE